MMFILWMVFFFNDTATTEIYTLSLHDALPIFGVAHAVLGDHAGELRIGNGEVPDPRGGKTVHIQDRKSTRLNSSHSQISYAVFCLKNKRLPIMFIIWMDTMMEHLIPAMTVSLF